MKQNQTLLIIVGIAIVLLLGNQLGLFSSVPAGSPTGFVGLVVNDGELVNSDFLDCRSGGVSMAQSGPVQIQSDGSYDLICVGGKTYEFFVDEVKYDTIWNVRAFGEVPKINIIKGDCGNYCNEPLEPLDCGWYKISGGITDNWNELIVIPGTGIPTKRGVEFGPAENGDCPERCAANGVRYNGANSAFDPAYVMIKLEGEIIGRKVGGQLLYEYGKPKIEIPESAEEVCVYTRDTRNFGLPSGRQDCKVCPSSEIYTPPQPEIECTIDSQCGSVYECVSNECVEKTCPTCPEDTEYGECNFIQHTKSKITYFCDASTNFECQEQYSFDGCTPLVDCEENSDCNEGYLCNEGDCIPDVECVSNVDCNVLMTCEFNQCVPKEVIDTVILENPGLGSINILGYDVEILILIIIGGLSIVVIIVKK